MKLFFREVKLYKSISVLMIILAGKCFAQSTPVTLRINPEEAIGCSSSKLFATIDYVPLETTKESLFGRIDQLYVTNEYYIVLDTDTNSILLFLRNGKFHLKIQCGRATDELKAKFFVIDKERKLIKVGYYFNKTKTYNFEGKLIISEEEKPEFEYLYFLPGSTSVSYALNYDYKKSRQDSADYEVKIKKNGKVFQQVFPYVNYNKVIGNMDRLSGAGSSFLESGDDSTVNLIRYYGYTVYSISGSGSRPIYNYIFPQQLSLPIDFMSNPAYYGKRIEYIKNNKDVIYAVSNFFSLNQFLFFKLKALAKGGESYIYDRSLNLLIAADHLESDAANCYLPITMNGSYRSANFITYSFLTTDGKCIYASVSSREMFNAYNASHGKKVKYDERLQEYFKNSSAKSNPVIIQLKPRSQFLL